jgi:hypothetical protein
LTELPKLQDGLRAGRLHAEALAQPALKARRKARAGLPAKPQLPPKPERQTLVAAREKLFSKVCLAPSAAAAWVLLVALVIRAVPAQN